MGKVEFPEWAKPGEKVLRVVGQVRGKKSFIEGTVTRLTPTRIVASFTGFDTQFTKSRTGKWIEYGSGSDWRAPAEIHDPNSELGKQLVVERTESYARIKAQNACNNFDRKGTLTEAKDAAEKLAAYIKIMEE